MGAIKIEIDNSVSLIQIIVNMWCSHYFSHAFPWYNNVKSIYVKDDGQEKQNSHMQLDMYSIYK